jgi:hypothetical protein
MIRLFKGDAAQGFGMMESPMTTVMLKPSLLIHFPHVAEL